MTCGECGRPIWPYLRGSAIRRDDLCTPDTCNVWAYLEALHGFTMDPPADPISFDPADGDPFNQPPPPGRRAPRRRRSGNRRG